MRVFVVGTGRCGTTTFFQADMHAGAAELDRAYNAGAARGRDSFIQLRSPPLMPEPAAASPSRQAEERGDAYWTWVAPAPARANEAQGRAGGTDLVEGERSGAVGPGPQMAPVRESLGDVFLRYVRKPSEEEAGPATSEGRADGPGASSSSGVTPDGDGSALGGPGHSRGEESEADASRGSMLRTP